MSQTGNRQHNGSQNDKRVEIINHIENIIINEDNSQQDNNGEPSSAELIQRLITELDQ
ncbi:5591_t:CDS:2, partial [Racocetra fulgida]